VRAQRTRLLTFLGDRPGQSATLRVGHQLLEVRKFGVVADELVQAVMLAHIVEQVVLPSAGETDPGHAVPGTEAVSIGVW
jgi:hypothetical protein